MWGPQRPKFGGDFGILDFGDFGFWILRFGGWKSLGAKFVTNFGFYIRVRRLCTPPRVGGLFCWQGQHEETFFKSTLPYFEWDGFGLGARSWCFLCEVPSKCQPQKRQISNRRKTRSKFQPLQSFQLFQSKSAFHPEILVYHHGARRWVGLFVHDFRVSSLPGILQAVFAPGAKAQWRLRSNQKWHGWGSLGETLRTGAKNRDQNVSSSCCLGG